MKKKTLILILLALLLCLLAVSYAVNGFSIRNISLGGYTYDHAERYAAGDARISGSVRELDVSWVSGKVNVTCHDGDNVRLSEKASRSLTDEESLHWWLDGEKLYVKYAASGFRGMEDMNKQLTVLVPQSWTAQQVTINVVSADVQAALSAETVTLSTVSGDANLTIPEARKISINTVSGNVCVEAEQLAQLAASSVSGDVRICLPQSLGFTAEMNSVSGDVDGSLPLHRVDGDRYVSGDGRCRISVSSVSGDVRLDQLEN